MAIQCKYYDSNLEVEVKADVNIIIKELEMW